MPLILAKILIGLPVETQHGTHLGKIVDLEIDIDNHAVKKYFVSSGAIVKHLLRDAPDLVIDPTQVVAITSEKMVVVDLETGQTVNAYEEISNNENRRIRSGARVASPVDEQRISE